MLERLLLALSIFMVLAGSATAQTPAAFPGGQPRPASSLPWNGTTTNAASSGNITGVTQGSGVLPNNFGQVWREYDIRPYTSKVTSTEKPQEAIIDWILRETGSKVWFSEPFGILSASKQTLRVYHTPDMQRIVAEIVDRFVSSQGESYVFSMRLLTVVNPNWRSLAGNLIRRIEVQTPGIDAWLISKENASVLLGELRKRTDFREHNSPNLLINNGQSQTVSRTRPRNYIRSVRMRNDGGQGHSLEMGQAEEGYTMQLSPLMSSDGRTIDAVVECRVDQIEKFLSINIEVPSTASARQRVQVQVPQRVSWNMRERFRWPSDQVLMISCGVVATPSSERMSKLGLPGPLTSGAPRAEALILIESNGKASQTLLDSQRTANGASPNYRGRY